jgi:pimeloyl-ACP methyl ester carboxylesterase
MLVALSMASPLHHRITGMGAPLLLIHGTGADADAWRAVAPVLSRSHRVIRYDRRGHGRSPGPAPTGPGTWAGHAEDARALLRSRAGREPALVVGWSSGAIIAMHLAAHHPDRVRALVLVEPSLWVRRQGDARTALAMLRVRWHAAKRPRHATATFYRAVCRYRDDGGNGFDALDADQRQSILGNAAAVLAELNAGTGEELSAADVRRIRCPVTMLLGSRSAPMFARAAQLLERTLPQLRTATVEGAGHLMMLEAPAAVAAWVNAAEAMPDAVGDAGYAECPSTL